MSTFDNIYQLNDIFKNSRTYVAKTELLEKLECSSKTLQRLINKMRDYYAAPLVYDKQYHGWHYTDKSYELPGIWFSEQQMRSLLILQELLSGIVPDLITPKLQEANDKILQIFAGRQIAGDDLKNKFKLIGVFNRTVSEDIFSQISTAVLTNRQINTTYIKRADQEQSTRTLSPQRMVYYKNVWYLDAYCHSKKELRVFALDAFEHVKILSKESKKIPLREINETTQSSYGIFSGIQKHIAVLHFKSPASFWVEKENWHHNQQTKWLDNDIFELKIPFNHPQELLADILKYGDKVTVIQPETLAKKMQSIAKAIVKNYSP